jgi:uncharacterized protein Usg
MRNMLGVFLFITGTLLMIYVAYTWATNPELTQMQIFMDCWIEWLSGAVLIGTSIFFFN